MKPPDNIDMSHDARYLHEGPNSGGVTGWFLRDGHMFAFAHDGPSGSIDDGVPVARWLARWRDSDDARVQAAVADLERRGY